MNEYLLVIYNTETKEFYNKVKEDCSKASALTYFKLFKRPEEVIINVIEL